MMEELERLAAVPDMPNLRTVAEALVGVVEKSGSRYEIARAVDTAAKTAMEFYERGLANLFSTLLSQRRPVVACAAIFSAPLDKKSLLW